ncbi:MAG: hypothetical protein ACYDAY_00880 [Candidatus Dormibacteria bacterium]
MNNLTPDEYFRRLTWAVARGVFAGGFLLAIIGGLLLLTLFALSPIYFRPVGPFAVVGFAAVVAALGTAGAVFLYRRGKKPFSNG